jgi:hypothetical protein
MVAQLLEDFGSKKMTTDKRSVFTDALETLGTIIDENQKRDAIHLAVEPVVAKEYLVAGDHVTVDGRRKTPYCLDAVGIVDPFLPRPGVKVGERFWLVLYPRTIKSLRHVWEHPAFPPSELQVEEPKEDESDYIENIKNKVIAKSKKWIEDYANSFPQGMYGEWVSYQDLMDGAEAYLESCKRDYQDYLCKGDVFENVSFNYDFWYHYEIVTGTKVDADNQQSFFTCSC